MLFFAASEIMASKNFQTIEIRELSHVIYYTQTVLDMCVVVSFPTLVYVCVSLNVVGSNFSGSYSVICLLSWFRFGKYLDVISPKTKMLSETVSTNHCVFFLSRSHRPRFSPLRLRGPHRTLRTF
jgi:hypothetical protein